MDMRCEAIVKRMDYYLKVLMELCEYKKESNFDLFKLTADEKFEILILNELKLLTYFDF